VVVGSTNGWAAIKLENGRLSVKNQVLARVKAGCVHLYWVAVNTVQWVSHKEVYTPFNPSTHRSYAKQPTVCIDNINCTSCK